MMSIHALKFAAFVLAGSLPGTASAAEPTAVISISVSNPMVAPRAHETVAVALAEILKTAPGFDVKNAKSPMRAGRRFSCNWWTWTATNRRTRSSSKPTSAEEKPRPSN
jgi:hypothetical protein